MGIKITTRTGLPATTWRKIFPDYDHKAMQMNETVSALRLIWLLVKMIFKHGNKKMFSKFDGDFEVIKSINYENNEVFVIDRN